MVAELSARGPERCRRSGALHGAILGDPDGLGGLDGAAAVPRGDRSHGRVTRLVLYAQGIYYVLTGVWPLVSMRTFESVTGPKTDDWLVHMVGALTIAIGITILTGARGHGVEKKVRREVILLSATSAVAYAAIDILYTLNGTIRSVYLADAGAEGLILLGLLVSRRKES